MCCVFELSHHVFYHLLTYSLYLFSVRWVFFHHDVIHGHCQRLAVVTCGEGVATKLVSTGDGLVTGLLGKVGDIVHWLRAFLWASV